MTGAPELSRTITGISTTSVRALKDGVTVLDCCATAELRTPMQTTKATQHPAILMVALRIRSNYAANGQNAQDHDGRGESTRLGATSAVVSRRSRKLARFVRQKGCQ